MEAPTRTMDEPTSTTRKIFLVDQSLLRFLSREERSHQSMLLSPRRLPRRRRRGRGRQFRRSAPMIPSSPPLPPLFTLSLAFETKFSRKSDRCVKSLRLAYQHLREDWKEDQGSSKGSDRGRGSRRATPFRRRGISHLRRWISGRWKRGGFR